MPRKAKPVGESVRDLHMDFVRHLENKEQLLVELFCDCRAWVLGLFPDCNELLYHTHALTTVFSISDKLGDAFCMIPIYSNHFNLAFNQGTRLLDPQGLLTGTGKLMRHIDVQSPADYRNPAVKALLRSAADLAVKELKQPTKCIRRTVSKIK
jgi:hypothetical protein